MDIIVKKSLFRSSFAAVAAIAPSRTTKVAWSMVLCEVDSGRIKLTATDGTVVMIEEITDCEIRKGGICLLPTDRIASILKESQSDDIRIVQNGTSLTVSAGSDKFTLQTIDPETFPTVEMPDTGYFEVSAEHLQNIIKRVPVACGEASASFALKSIFIECELRDNGEAESLQFVACESRRLAAYSAPAKYVPGKSKFITTGLIQKDHFQRIGALATDGDVQIANNGNAFFFRCGNRKMSIQQTEGRFPKWQKILPNKAGRDSFDTSAATLLSAVRRASIACEVESRALSLNFAADKVTLSAETASVGNSLIEIPINFSGEPITNLIVDSKLLNDLLSSVGDSEVSISLNGTTEAVLLNEGEHFAAVVMPCGKGD
jgi:DNA polymerase III beta subunit